MLTAVLTSIVIALNAGLVTEPVIAAPPRSSEAGAGLSGSSSQSASKQAAAKKKSSSAKKPASKKNAGAKLTIKAPAVVAVKKRFTVKASFGRASVSRSIRVERQKGKNWTKVAEKRVGKSSSTASVSLTATAGSQRIRTRLVSMGRSLGVSRSIAPYGVYACGVARAPKQNLTYTTTDPTKRSGKSIVEPLTAALCSAAKGSTVTVGVYIVRSTNSQVAPIFRALEYQARMNKVKVRFLLESGNGGANAKSISALKAWATVKICRYGCTNYEPGNGHINHTKFVAVSSTKWPSRKSFVWYSSANFSNRQMADYWQNAVSVVGDKQFYSATVKSYDALSRCATGAANCRRAGLQKAAGSSIYGFRQLKLPTGSGLSVTADLYPKVDSSDPTLDVLRATSCERNRGGKVYIASYLWSNSRAKNIAREIKRLKGTGCDVRVIYSRGGFYYSKPEVMRPVLTSGAQVRSKNLMHIKAIHLAGVTFNGAKNRFVYFAGNQNFTYTGLRTNNENMVLISAPMNSNASGVSSFRRSIESHWWKMWGADTNIASAVAEPPAE